MPADRGDMRPSVRAGTACVFCPGMGVLFEIEGIGYLPGGGLAAAAPACLQIDTGLARTATRIEGLRLIRGSR